MAVLKATVDENVEFQQLQHRTIRDSVASGSSTASGQSTAQLHPLHGTKLSQLSV